MPSAAWSGDQSKAIELTRLTQMVQYAKRCMAIIRFIQVTQEGYRIHLFDSGGTGQPSQKGEFLNNQTCPVDSGGAGCQTLHGFAGDLRQSNSSSTVRLWWRGIPGAS